MTAWREHSGRAGATRDAIAAGTIAAVAIPSSLGYAEVAGLPVVVGLYATMLPLVGRSSKKHCRSSTPPTGRLCC